MEIVIGASPKVARIRDKTTQITPGVIEAKVLHVRPPRTGRRGPYNGQDKRVNGSPREDPAGGRVMLLLIDEGYKVPKDIQSGNYRVMVRFVRR